MHTHEDHSSPDYRLKDPGHEDGGQVQYYLEDFSQQAINRGQQRINYSFVVVDQKLAKAIEALRDAIAGTPLGCQIDFDAVDGAISEVYEASKKVAGDYPPGCSSPGPTRN